MKMFTLGLLALCLMIGCSPHVPTVDEEIANQPDEGGMGWQIGASSNNWALLARVVAVEDVQERIRLVTALQASTRATARRLRKGDRLPKQRLSHADCFCVVVRGSADSG